MLLMFMLNPNQSNRILVTMIMMTLLLLSSSMMVLFLLLLLLMMIITRRRWSRIRRISRYVYKEDHSAAYISKLLI